MTWVNPKTIIGPPAEGEKYLQRPQINQLFWDAIENGEHARFTAPRRVGKSSVMKDMEANPPKDMIVIYQNIEADKTSKDFYKRLWTLISNKIQLMDSLKAKFLKWFHGRKIGEISVEGNIKIAQQEISYKEELLSLVETLGKEGQMIVLLLDEFPDVLVSIQKNEGAEAAVDVLHTIRAIRHDQKFKNFRLVLAGSIGLEHVIASIDRYKIINDLKPIPIPALSQVEAHELLNKLLDGASMQFEYSEREYMLEKVGHLLPFFIQLMIAQCNTIALSADDPKITTSTIDQAFNGVVENNEHFTDWEKRLKDYLGKNDFNYCIGLLTRCAHQKFTLQQAYNYAKENEPDTSYMGLIDDVLVKDGYLLKEQHQLRFHSPFLLAWWQKRHPAFEIEN